MKTILEFFGKSVKVKTMKKALLEERKWRKRIISKRYSLGLTQAQLAKKAGLRRGTIANIEGGYQRATLETAFKLRKVLGVSP